MKKIEEENEINIAGKTPPSQDEILEALTSLISNSAYYGNWKVAMLRYVFEKEQPRVVISDNHPQFTPILPNETRAYNDGRRDGIKSGISTVKGKIQTMINDTDPSSEIRILLLNVMYYCDAELEKCK